MNALNTIIKCTATKIFFDVALLDFPKNGVGIVGVFLFMKSLSRFLKPVRVYCRKLNGHEAVLFKQGGHDQKIKSLIPGSGTTSGMGDYGL